MLQILERPRRASSDEDIHHAKAKRASSELLGRLRLFHAELMQSDETVQVTEPVIETVERTTESEPGEVNEPAIPIKKDRWFSVEKDLGAVTPRAIRIDEIIGACAAYYRVSATDIKSARRTAKVMRPRQVGYYLSRVLTLRTLPEIGRRFGGRDHTSALSGIRKIERLRQTDARLESDLHAVAAMVGGSLGN